MAQDEPFNEFPRRRVAHRFLDGGGLARPGLAREIDRILDRREITRERRSVRTWRRHVAGPRRLVLRRDVVLCVLGFLERRVAVVPPSARLMRLLAVMRIMIGPCGDV